MKIEMDGTCETCRHLVVDSYDPSPPGISLSPGSITDYSCGNEANVPEELQEYDHKTQWNGVECPGWASLEPVFCDHCKKWYLSEYCFDCFSMCEGCTLGDSCQDCSEKKKKYVPWPWEEKDNPPVDAQPIDPTDKDGEG